MTSWCCCHCAPRARGTASRRCAISIRSLRFRLQSGVLGLGAYLVIQQQAPAGIIIASSIIVARALAPVELAIANWKQFVSARQSWRRLSDFLGAMEKGPEPMALPAPKSFLSVEAV